MAVDVEALKALGLSDQEIAQIAAIESGGFQPITATPQAVTNPVAGAYDYTPLYGGGDIIPGLTGGIFEKLGLENPNVPVFRLLGSENKGGNNVNESMNFAAIPGQSYRLVNNATGEVLGEASTPEGISALVEQSNALSRQLGNKADISFETSTPEVFGGGYSPIFEDKPNELVGGLLGNVMDIGIPLIANLAIPGGGLLGSILPSAAGSAASSVLQGRGLEDTLLRAAIAGAGAGVGDTLTTPAKVVGDTASSAVTSTAGNVVGQTAAQKLAEEAAKAAAGEILVTGARSFIPSLISGSAGGLASSIVPSFFDNAQLSDVVQGPQPTDQTYTPPTEDLIVTATQPNVTGVFPAVTSGISNTLLDQVINQPPAAPSTPPAEPSISPGEIVVTAQPTNLLPAALATGAAATAAASANAAGSTSTQADRVTPTAAETAALNAGAAGGGVLGTGLTATELLTAAGLGSSLLGSLFGGSGGGGTGAGAPYVSQLGAMPVFGQRTQINPNITDYEKYGFGPEAMFFSGGQTLNTYTPPATAIPSPATTASATPTTSSGPAQQSLLNAATTPAATTPTVTTPAVTTPSGPPLQGFGPFAGSQLGGGVVATPENTGMTQQRLTQLQDRYENMRSPEFFNYFKAVNDVLGNYRAKGYITTDQAKEIQSRLEAAASVPNATLQSLQLSVPMPQFSDFVKPTGTTTQYGPPPQPIPQMTYTAPTQPIVDRSAYINDLYKQIGANISQGLLAVPQAQALQSQLRQAYLSPQSTTEQLQSIYNTGMQQYRPLI